MRTRSSKGLLSPLGLTLVAVLALGAILGSAAASAATQHWYGHSGSTRLLEETPTEVNADDISTTTLKFFVAGAELKIRCGSLDADGEIENPSGGVGGKHDEVTFTFDECVVETPAGGGCVVPASIETNVMKGEATKFEGSPAVKYAPASGSAVTTFSVTGTKCAFWSGSKTITGSFTALYSGIGGYWSVTNLSSADLLYGGQPAVKLNTEYLLDSAAGEPVAMATDTSPAGEHWYLGGPPSEASQTKLAEGAATSYSSVAGSMSSTISATIGGVKFKIQCGGSSSAEGTVENPVGGGAGTATGTIDFGGCVVPEPTGGKCSVDGGGAVSVPLSGFATEAGGSPAASFSPAEKTTIVTFTISGAKCPEALKGPKSLTGSLTGVPDPFGTYAFSGAEGLKLAGQAATFSAQVTLETSTGERLGLAP